MNKKIYNNLIEILLKKASGFYYTEEQEEYEKTQKKSNISEKPSNNLNFFEIYDTLEPESNNASDTIKSSNGKTQKQNNQDLVLVKKKITTHYIPPDMLAVKILFETIKEKVNEDDLEKLSDKELLNLKEKLLGELINEDKQN